MTALQSFKLSCIVGAQCKFKATWCPTETLRTVTIVQTRKVAFTHPTRPSTNSWLDFPKAANITEPQPGLFKIESPEDPNNILWYDFGQG